MGLVAEDCSLKDRQQMDSLFIVIVQQLSFFVSVMAIVCAKIECDIYVKKRLWCSDLFFYLFAYFAYSQGLIRTRAMGRPSPLYRASIKHLYQLLIKHHLKWWFTGKNLPVFLSHLNSGPAYCCTQFSNALYI